MEDAMVTGRMSAQKKAEGNAVLSREGLNASAAIGMLYDKLIQEQNAGFLFTEAPVRSKEQWQQAASFVSQLVTPRASKYHNMTKGEVKMERYARKQA